MHDRGVPACLTGRFKFQLAVAPTHLIHAGLHVPAAVQEMDFILENGIDRILVMQGEIGSHDE